MKIQFHLGSQNGRIKCIAKSRGPLPAGHLVGDFRRNSPWTQNFVQIITKEIFCIGLEKIARLPTSMRDIAKITNFPITCISFKSYSIAI